MIHGEKPFVARERTNNKLTQYGVASEISTRAAFSMGLRGNRNKGWHTYAKKTHFNTAQVS